MIATTMVADGRFDVGDDAQFKLIRRAVRKELHVYKMRLLATGVQRYRLERRRLGVGKSRKGRWDRLDYGTIEHCCRAALRSIANDNE